MPEPVGRGDSVTTDVKPKHSWSWGRGGERRGGPGAERGREMRWALASAEAGGAHGWRGCEVRWALASAGQARPGAGPEPDGGGPRRRIRRRRRKEEEAEEEEEENKHKG